MQDECEREDTRKMMSEAHASLLQALHLPRAGTRRPARLHPPGGAAVLVNRFTDDTYNTTTGSATRSSRPSPPRTLQVNNGWEQTRCPSPPTPALSLSLSKGMLVVGATGWVDNYNVPEHWELNAEVACNLLDPGRIQCSGLLVLKVSVGKGYFTDFSQEKIIELYLQ